MSVATQRLRIPKQPNCWKPQQREINPWGRCLLSGAQTPYFDGQQINGQRREERRQRRKDTHREERHRREIKDADQGRSKQQIQRATGPLRDATSEGHNTL
jgi:hypothetical protein